MSQRGITVKCDDISGIQVMVLGLALASVLTLVFFAASGMIDITGNNERQQSLGSPPPESGVPELQAWGSSFIPTKELLLRNGSDIDLDLTLEETVAVGSCTVAAGSAPTSITNVTPAIVNSYDGGILSISAATLEDGAGEFIIHITAEYDSSGTPVVIVWSFDITFYDNLILY